MATQTKPNKKNTLRNVLLVVLVLVLLMLMTTLVAFFVARNIVGSDTNKKADITKDHITYDAGEFLTNLSDKGYIKISLVYLLNGKDTEKELSLKDSEIRDKIFTILRSKDMNSVKDSNSMDDLRKQIKDSINTVLTKGNVVDVYFTSIIVN